MNMKQATVTAFVSLLFGLEGYFFLNNIESFKSVPKILDEILRDRTFFSRKCQNKCQANKDINK